MSIDASTAAEIARKNGLTLHDAAALQSLASTEQEADRIAARFRSPETEMRQFVQNLFDGREPPSTDRDRQPPANPEEQTQRFLAGLFGEEPTA